MSELDNFLGPHEKPSMPSAKRTHFGRYPDCQELCDVFISEMEWSADPYTIRQVAAGARDFKLAVGNKPDLLLKAIKRMRNKGLDIASPRSCITMARKIVPDPDSEEGRRRYVTGKYADFWGNGEDDD